MTLKGSQSTRSWKTPRAGSRARRSCSVRMEWPIRRPGERYPLVIAGADAAREVDGREGIRPGPPEHRPDDDRATPAAGTPADLTLPPAPRSSSGIAPQDGRTSFTLETCTDGTGTTWTTETLSNPMTHIHTKTVTRHASVGCGSRAAKRIRLHLTDIERGPRMTIITRYSTELTGDDVDSLPLMTWETDLNPVRRWLPGIPPQVRTT